MNSLIGLVNENFTLVDQNINGFRKGFYNLTEPDLITQSIVRAEGQLGIGGSLLVETGKFTGRSPKDKHVVVSDSTENTIWWERNARMSENSLTTFSLLTFSSSIFYFGLSVKLSSTLNSNFCFFTVY